MFDFFKKQAPEKKPERNPVNLPVLALEEVKLDVISQHLKAGHPIWTWYSILDRVPGDTPLMHYEELRAVEKGRLDGFAAYIKQDDFLYRYDVDIDQDSQEPVLRLETIWPYKNSVLFDVINSYIKPAHKVYYDPDQMTENQMFYVHDLTPADIALYLQTHDHMYITEDHFKKIEKED